MGVRVWEISFMIKTGTHSDGNSLILFAILPSYMGVGSMEHEGEWRAVVLIEYSESIRESMYCLLTKMKEQKKEPLLALNIPGESALIFNALMSNIKDIEPIIGDTKLALSNEFHFFTSSGLQYDTPPETFETFLSLYEQDKFYLINVIERDPNDENYGSPHLVAVASKTIFSFQMTDWKTTPQRR